MSRGQPPLSDEFIAELIRLLRVAQEGNLAEMRFEELLEINDATRAADLGQGEVVAEHQQRLENIWAFVLQALLDKKVEGLDEETLNSIHEDCRLWVGANLKRDLDRLLRWFDFKLKRGLKS